MTFQTYAKSENGGALRQGEILTNFIQYQLDVDKLRDQQPLDVLQIPHPYVVVLSQDCDLDQDYTRRKNGKIDNLLASVLFCSVALNDDDFRHGIGLNTKEWRKVLENREPRLHYLRAVPKADDSDDQGLPDLVVDFRQYFALPRDEAYLCAEAAHRRCRLDTPYAEHLSQRFFSYMARVALPLDHHLPLPAPVVAEVVEAPAQNAAAPAAAAGNAGAPAGGGAPAAGVGENGAPIQAPPAQAGAQAAQPPLPDVQLQGNNAPGAG